MSTSNRSARSIRRTRRYALLAALTLPAALLLGCMSDAGPVEESFAAADRARAVSGEAAHAGGAAERPLSAVPTEPALGARTDVGPGPVMATLPEQTVWVADGFTEYKLHIYVDNSGLEPGFDLTKGVQWGFLNNPGFDFISVTLPEIDDFFEGFQMLFQILGGPGEMSARITCGPSCGNPVEYAVQDRQGYVATYTFTVPIGTPAGEYSFDLFDTL